MLETGIVLFFGAWVVGLSIWIILDRRSPTATLGWIIALMFLPYLGVPVYLLIGPRKWVKKKLHLEAARERISARLGKYLNRAFLNVMQALPPETARLVELGNRTGYAAAGRAREITLYHEGIDFYAALEEAIRGATHHIHLEFYIWTRGKIGTRFRDLLVEKANEGVEVRLLLDSVGSTKFSRKFARPLEDAGGKIVIFNRPRFLKTFRFRPQLVNFRTHRKIVVVDGHTGFTGGINIDDCHSSEFVGADARRDTHLRMRGEAVSWLQLVFLENWHFATGSAPSGKSYLAVDDTEGDHFVQIAGSGPDNEAAPIHKIYFSLINAATTRLWLTSAYFVPDEPIVTALQTAALRGVDVRILVPAKSDQFTVRAASRTYYDELLFAGVSIFEYQPRMHHGKTMIVDHDVAIVGSANVDNRSFRLNFEVIATLFCRDAVEELAEKFEEDLAASRQVEFGEEGRRAFPLRVIDGVARLFSPLL